MKKILFFILLSMSLTCFAQDSLNIDSKQTNGADSIHASHTTFSSNTLEDATKAEKKIMQQLFKYMKHY